MLLLMRAWLEAVAAMLTAVAVAVADADAGISEWAVAIGLVAHLVVFDDGAVSGDQLLAPTHKHCSSFSISDTWGPGIHTLWLCRLPWCCTFDRTSIQS